MPPVSATRFQLLLHYLKQHWISYSFGVLAILATNWIAVSIPQYVQKSIDLLYLDIEAMQERLWEYMWIMIGLAVSMILVRILSRILFFNPGRAIECRIKNDMFHQLMGLQREYFVENPSGNIISRINNDINHVRMLYGFGMMQICNILSALSMTPYKMWQLSPKLTLYCVLPVLAVFILVRLGMHLLVKNMRARMASLQELSGFTISSLSGIDVIKSYALHEWVLKRFEVENQEMVHRGLKIAWIRSFLMPLLTNLENLLKLLVLSAGGIMVISNLLTIGELTAFITYTTLLTMPLMAFGWLTTMFQRGLIGLESIRTVLQQDLPRKRIGTSFVSSEHNFFSDGINVRDLRFRYPSGTRDVLADISLSIRPGQVVGLLGRIGSGKTTLVNCLNRYLEVENGMIMLGAHDLNTLPDHLLRRSIRTVEQEPFLFSDTVAENIRFGLDDSIELDPERLREILRISALAEEVDRFPKHEQTLVGEKGIMLSGGQKQRISLARALARRCDLLILDNVFSAVDYETERFLLREILRLMHHFGDAPPLAKSILIVSHRVTSMEKTDLILVLEEGRIADQGKHAELIRRPGYFQQMWQLQNEDEHA